MVKKKTTKKPVTRKKASKTTKKIATRKPATKKPRSKARQVYVALPQTKVAGKTYNKKIDKKLIAKKPGKRISANGKVYYEYRVNRSDINKYY